MKRAALVVTLFILVAAGVLAWWLMTRPAVSVATVLPADTMMLARIPDGWATAKRYDKSKLRQVVESDELGFVFGYLLASASQESGTDILARLEKLETLTNDFWQNLSGECFIALFDLDLKQVANNGMVLGLRPFPGTNNMPKFIDKVKSAMAEDLAGHDTGTGTYGEVTYQWVELTKDFRLCQGEVGGYTITAIGEGAFKRFVDAVNDPSGPKLADTQLYKQVAEELKEPMDAEFFFNFLPLKERILDQMAADPALADDVPMLREAYGPVTAFGAGMRFTGNGNIEDVWISLMPLKDRPDLGDTFTPCEYRTLKYTGPDTVVYFAQNIDWKCYWDYLVMLYSNSPELIQGLNLIENTVKSFGLDLHKNILDALGPEFAFQMDWPADQGAPQLGVYLQVDDWPAFGPTVDAIMKVASSQTSDNLGAAEPLGSWSAEELPGGVELQTFTIPNNALSPTLISKGPLFGVFLTKASAKHILASDPATNVTTQPPFTSLGVNMEGTSSFTYVEMSDLLTRSYKTFRTLAEVAGLYAPQLAQQFDTSHMPETLSVTKPLGAWAMVAYVTPEAGVARSVSAIGNPIVPTALTMGVAAPLLEDMTSAFAPLGGAAAPGPDLTADPKSPEAIRSELDELRAVIDAWATATKAPAGTPVKWEELDAYFIPGSRLEESGGSDALGNPYVLGIVGEQPADVAPETKNSFPDRDDSFWAPQVTPAPNMPGAEPKEAPADEEPVTS